MTPQELMTAFPHYTFVVHEKKKGEPLEHGVIPMSVYIRYEIEKDMLYIDSRFITQEHLVEEAVIWRKSSAYCGTLLKRISAGTGYKAKPIYCLAFDLSYGEQGDTTSRIRKRKGRPLQVANTAKLTAKAKEVAPRLKSLNTRLMEWQKAYEHLALWDDLYEAIKEAKKFYEDSYSMLSQGRRKRIMPDPSPIKTIKKEIILPKHKIYSKGLDELIARDTDAIFKNIREFRTDEKGVTTLYEKEFRPILPREEWIARYEQGTTLDGKTVYKHLYVLVSVLKSGAYENEDIKDYKRDVRFVQMCQKQVGKSAHRCAFFDLTKKLDNEIIND